MPTQRSRLSFILACLAAGALAPNLRAASYTVIYLQPAGMDTSVGFGAANGQQAGYEAGDSTASLPQAVIWTSSAGTALNINPAGFDSSLIQATDGTHQVGLISNSSTSANDAAIWTSTAISAVDLNPSGMTASIAYAISGNQEVGNAFGPSTGGMAHAMLWTGNNPNAIDLHPTNGVYDFTTAQGIAGGQQVGYGEVAITPGVYHALLWTGSAGSVVDLNPSSAGFTYSQAFATSGTQQVGLGMSAATGTNSHALLWSGTATNFQDLNPNGYDGSQAEAISGNEEVGWGFKSGSTESTALLWSGSAGTAVDLQQYLSADYTSSQAWSIAPDGTIVGQAFNSTLDQTEAVMWVPTAVPEPGSLALLAGLCTITLMRSRRQGRFRRPIFTVPGAAAKLHARLENMQWQENQTAA